MILQTAMSYCVVMSPFATESVPRMGGQGGGQLERQESQAEASDAEDAEIHRLRLPLWRRRRLGRRRRRLYADEEGCRRQSAQADRSRGRRIARKTQSQSIGRRNEPPRRRRRGRGAAAPAAKEARCPCPCDETASQGQVRLGHRDGRRRGFTAVTAEKDIGCEDSEGERR